MAVTIDARVWHDDVEMTTSLTVEICCSCAVPFAIPTTMFKRAKRDSGQWFHCPNGHIQHYTESDIDRLTRERDSARRRAQMAEEASRRNREAAQTAKRQAAAYKGLLTKARKRAGAGVCPVTECHRTVKQMADHMATKHPDYDAQAV